METAHELAQRYVSHGDTVGARVAAYLVVATVTLAISYQRAWRHEKMGRLGAALAGPVTLALSSSYRCSC